ncbi:MAG: SIS domain-containing protein [bacterium]
MAKFINFEAQKFSVSSYQSRFCDIIQQVDKQAIEGAIALILEAWQAGRKIFTCGNGGSALAASHFITDWNKSIFMATGRPFYGICLNDNIGLLTAYANDVSYEDVFREQLKNFMSPKDLLLVISGSGNSPNVLRAVEYANENGGKTLAFCGFDGGKVKSLAQHAVWVPCHDMQICEDIHLVLGHMVMKALCGAPIK